MPKTSRLFFLRKFFQRFETACDNCWLIFLPFAHCISKYKPSIWGVYFKDIVIALNAIFLEVMFLDDHINLIKVS